MLIRRIRGPPSPFSCSCSSAFNDSFMGDRVITDEDYKVIEQGVAKVILLIRSISVPPSPFLSPSSPPVTAHSLASVALLARPIRLSSSAVPR